MKIKYLTQTTILLAHVYGLAHLARPGTIFISRVENEPTHMSLKATKDGLILDSEGSSFDRTLNGSLKLIGSNLYLGFNFWIYLDLKDSPDYGFSLVNIPGLRFTRHLAYKGSKKFYLCQDSKMRADMNCKKPRLVEITFEDRLREFRKFRGSHVLGII